MEAQIQPSVDFESIHPSALPPPEMEPAPPPRTAAASRKRLKHGLYSRHAVIPGEDRDAFRDYRNDTILDQQPVTPEEADLVEQMVMAQWQLKRVWATQTGVYERFEQAFPAVEGASRPQRLAQCFLDDCAGGQALDRLSRHVTRLVNVYHKCGRKLDLMREQRRKLLLRPKGAPYAKEELLYAAPEPAPPAAVPPSPAPPPVVARAETTATPSPGTASGEIADRGRAAAAAPDRHPRDAVAGAGTAPDGAADRVPAARSFIVADGEPVDTAAPHPSLARAPSAAPSAPRRFRPRSGV